MQNSINIIENPFKQLFKMKPITQPCICTICKSITEISYIFTDIELLYYCCDICDPNCDWYNDPILIRQSRIDRALKILKNLSL